MIMIPGILFGLLAIGIGVLVIVAAGDMLEKGFMKRPPAQQPQKVMNDSDTVINRLDKLEKTILQRLTGLQEFLK